MPSFRTTRRVPFTPRQMFDLVADVERYPEFLPLCEALTIKSRARDGDSDVLIADMTVGYKAVRETFTSRVTLQPAVPEVVVDGVTGTLGPFAKLQNKWHFRPAPGGSDIDFFITYEFKSLPLRMLVGALFDRAFRRYTSAFEERARVIYGREAAVAREIS